MNSPVNPFSESLTSPTSQTLTPISQPNHPRQHRAIGLIKGIFQRLEGRKSHGKLITADGTEIEGVFLGKMFSLLKNHLDLTQSHLWVVYPRTLPKNNELYVQIAGIWEPDTLKPSQTDLNAPENFQDGFFSIRGEVVYASPAKEVIFVKIRQSPKKKDKKTKFFKLKLRGILSDKPVGHFWDFTVQQEQHQLKVKSAEDLGYASKGKPFIKNRQQKPFSASKPPIRGIRKPSRPASGQFSLPKPMKKTEDTKDT